MALSQTQSKRGHLRGTDKNTKPDATGRPSGAGGQSKNGYPYASDPGMKDSGGAEHGNLTGPNAVSTNYRGAGPAPGNPRPARSGLKKGGQAVDRIAKP